MDSERLREAVAAITAAPHPPIPWRDGRQIPWNDPAFSERMLRIHLDQSTHMASRSREVIASHVRWLRQIMKEELPAAPARKRVLDIGCGPGLYCHELARRGHEAIGFDFAPAPLTYARQIAERERLDCRFLEADLTTIDEAFLAQVGRVDVATFWYGEFHSFPPETAHRFLARIAQALVPGGLFVLEYQPFELYLREDTQEWAAVDRSAFSDSPHLWLQEYHWDERQQSEINVHWIIDAASGDLSRYAQCSRAYRDAELVELCRTAGLERPDFRPPITGVSERYEFAMLVVRRAS
jgi:SAM-dependent methyltransferase